MNGIQESLIDLTTNAVRVVPATAFTVSVSGIGISIPNPMGVSGTVSVGNFPASQPVTIVDGGDVTLGSRTDAAVVGDASGSVNAHLRGLTTILDDVHDGINHELRISIADDVNIGNFPAIQAISGSVTVINASSNNQGTGNGGTSPWAVSGTVTVANPASVSIPNPIGVSGVISVDNFPAIQAVSGTVTVANPSSVTVPNPIGVSGTVNVQGVAAAGVSLVGVNPVVIGMNSSGGTSRFLTSATSTKNTNGIALLGVGLLAFDSAAGLYRDLAVDSLGVLAIAGCAASGALTACPPVLIAGASTDSIKRTLLLNTDGSLPTTNFTFAISSLLTRAANANAYAAGDSLVDTASGIQTLTGIARVSGGTGAIERLTCSVSSNAATKPVLRVWILDTTRTPTADNIAYTHTDGVNDTVINYIDLVANAIGDPTANSGNFVLDSGPIHIPFKTVGSANLFFSCQVLNAYTPGASSDTHLFRCYGYQN